VTHHVVPAWRKASRSTGSGACVEIAVLSDGAVGIRDSKRPETNLVIPPFVWSSFLTQTKHGTYDL
jgi:hypothetical protein